MAGARSRPPKKRCPVSRTGHLFGICRSYLHSVIVCMAVSASPKVGYLPSILYFFMSPGSVFMVVHFFVIMSSMTKISSANAGDAVPMIRAAAIRYFFHGESPSRLNASAPFKSAAASTETHKPGMLP